LTLVRQDVISPGDLLESGFGSLVSRISIRMVLERELPVGGPDLADGCGFKDVQSLVMAGHLT
jgi:hypothetical protein